MGGVNVKNTMIERVLQMIAPHPCSGCGKVGAVLCNDCKYDIIQEPFLGCILCGKPEPSGVCEKHEASFKQAFTVSVRTTVLENAINRLKFQNTKAAAWSLAELLHETLPILPSSLMLVPLPTVPSHVRQRGFDQVALMTKHLARLRNIPILNALHRQTNATQHTVGREERQSQASAAFVVDNKHILKGTHLLLVDDIVTTGSSVSAASKLLSEAGATVWVATLAYQPLD